MWYREQEIKSMEKIMEFGFQNFNQSWRSSLLLGGHQACHDWASSLLSSARSRLVSSLLLSLSLSLSLSKPSRRVRNSAEASWQCYLCILSSAPLPNWPSVQMRAKTILPVSKGPDHVIPESFPLQICTFFFLSFWCKILSIFLSSWWAHKNRRLE